MKNSLCMLTYAFTKQHANVQFFFANHYLEFLFFFAKSACTTDFRFLRMKRNSTVGFKVIKCLKYEKLPSLVRYHACLPSYAKLAKIKQVISRKLPKTFFMAKIWPILAHIWPKYFFQPLRPPLPVRYHACLSSYAKLAKTNDAISRK